MSSYLSSRYLKTREALRSQTIDEDLLCAACGYNVRGLNYGRACPECGVTITPRAARDVLLDVTPEQRSRYRTGFLLASLCLAFAALLRLIRYFSVMPMLPTIPVTSYLIAGAVNAVMFVIAVWLITPRDLDSRYLRWRHLRRAVRLTSLLWIPAYACWIAQQQAAPGSTLIAQLLLLQIVLRAAAGVGVILLAVLYQRIVVDIELEELEPTLRNLIWFTPVITVLLVPITIGPVLWIVWSVMLLLMVPWCYLVASLALVMWRLFEHVRWGMRAALATHDRSGRITARRAEMDAEVESRIRPMQ